MRSSVLSKTILTQKAISKGVISLTGNSDQSHTICGSEEAKPERKGRSSSTGLFSAEHMGQLPFLDPLTSLGPMSSSKQWAVMEVTGAASGLESLTADARASGTLSVWFGSYWWATPILIAELPAGPLGSDFDRRMPPFPSSVTHNGHVGKARNGFEPLRFGVYCYDSKTYPVLNDTYTQQALWPWKKCLKVEGSAFHMACFGFFPSHLMTGLCELREPFNHTEHL